LPYPFQQSYHGSPAKFRLLGGAAGPGKTLALIIEHMITCNEFTDPVQALQVHTLLFRRTFPKLESTVITRFREKIPRELYRNYNEAKHEVTWLNGATTRFGSMHYEHNVWDWQGQWLLIDYDEMTEFTFKQWSGVNAWNRCPVSPYSRRGGATNPIGIGAGWVHSLFVLNKPCDEMDANQKAEFKKDDYAYFPGTYLDNPVYANDPEFIRNLDSYPAAIRDALKHGTWGLAGGYFQGAWDEAANVYAADSFQLQPWYPRWLSGDWGFEHWSAIYAHCIDDFGIVRTYREFVTDHEPPKMLAESIVREFAFTQEEIEAAKEQGIKLHYLSFPFSHDAFAQKQDVKTIAIQMSPALLEAGLPAPLNAGRDLVGRGQAMYDKLHERVKVGEVYNDETGKMEPVEMAAWQIADCCPKLIAKIPLAPRDETDSEKLAEFLYDDPIHGAGHGIYWKFGRTAKKPHQQVVAAALEKIKDPTQRHLTHLKMEAQHKRSSQPMKRPGDWRSRLEEM
jgi:hypothetical protein